MNETIHKDYIRVSSISSAFANYGKIPQHVLDRAAARGEFVHRLIFDYTNDIAIPRDRYEFMGDSLGGYFESFLKFWKPYEKAEILLQEERLYDHNDKITGEPDLLCRINDENVLIDWKCTSAIGKHWIIQAGGYNNLLVENRLHIPQKILFVKLDKEGKDPIVTEYNQEISFFIFTQAFNLYKIFLKDQTCNLENE